MKKLCEYCNKEFETKKGHNNQRFCCKSCSIKARHPYDDGLFSGRLSNEVICYIIGLIITDGCITTSNGVDYIVISLKDEYMIKQIRDYVCPTKKVYRDGDNFQVKWRNENDMKKLNLLGISKRKTFVVPFTNLVDKYVWHYVRGLFDGDGCIFASNIHDKKCDKDYQYAVVSFTTASQKMTDGLVKFLNNNGISTSISQDKRHNNTYSVRISKQKEVRKFYDNMYANSGDWKLNRKYERFNALL